MIANNGRFPSNDEVLSSIDIVGEAERWGLRIASSMPNGDGWISCHAFDRDDDNPSASLNVNSGQYKDHGGDNRSVQFFDLIAELSNGHFIDWKAAKDYYRQGGNTAIPPKAAPQVERTRKRKADATGYALMEGVISEMTGYYGKPSRVWVYTDEAGDPIRLTFRADPPGRDKVVRPASKGSDGLWRQGDSTTPHPIYNRQRMASAKTVFIVEGEKCCDAIEGLGLVATTSPFGAKSAKKADWSPLTNKAVFILPDKDSEGEGYAKDVSELATAAGALSVKILRLPGLDDGEDVVDWIEKSFPAGTPSSDIRNDLVLLSQEAEAVDDGSRSWDIFSIAELIDEFPNLKPPVVEGLFREQEVINIISDPKRGKSWLAYGLALSVANGVDWLETYNVNQGRVLIIDNELHGETIASRIPRVAEAMGVGMDNLDILPLRGDLTDLYGLSGLFESIERDTYRVIVLDAFYRFLPSDISENDNAAVAGLYNRLDQYARMSGAAIACIHHASKGTQSFKRTTDVGAGAGAQSRAADCHLVLREHEDDGCVVLNAEVRSFPPVGSCVLRWDFPVWRRDTVADPSRLKGLDPQAERRRDCDLAAQGDILDALEENGAMTRGGLRNATGFNRDKVNRLVTRLMKDGFVEETPVEVKGTTYNGIRRSWKARDTKTNDDDPVHGVCDV